MVYERIPSYNWVVFHPPKKYPKINQGFFHASSQLSQIATRPIPRNERLAPMRSRQTKKRRGTQCLAPFTGGTCGKSKLYNADQGFFRLLSWVPTPTIWSVFALSKNARFWRNPWLKKLNEVFWPNFFGVQKPAGVGDLVERIGSKAKQQNLSDSIFLCDRKHDPKKGPHFRSLFFWKGNGRTPAMLPWGFYHHETPPFGRNIVGTCSNDPEQS